MRTKVYRYNVSAAAQEQAIETVIHAVERCKVRASLSASADIKRSVLSNLRLEGWPGEVMLGTGSRITVTSVRDRVGLCFQTGNVARMYADLLKLQTLYEMDRISAGILLLPEIDCARILGRNIANVQRLQRELTLFRPVISMPLALIGFSQ
jgi:hypothetical protein